ncbi:MAG: DNA-directed RNA polymerase subunit delta [Firmicutes bacterium]|nr:DNA-directed RNA polymerase subunit delta [Candidatus Fiminaster equi]
MNEKSLLDYGFDVLSASKDPLKFVDLFNAAIKASGLELAEGDVKKKMSKFYTSLSLDGRFVTLTDNYWDLRTRHVFEQVHLDMIDAYSDEDEEIDEEERKLLAEELGEVEEDDSEEEADDLDFDKPVKDADDDEEL